MLLDYFKQNPYDHPRYARYHNNPEALLRQIDFSSLQDKISRVIGPIDHPSVFYYNPPLMTDKKPSLTEEGIMALSAAEFNFLRGYTIDIMTYTDPRSPVYYKDFDTVVRKKFSENQANLILSDRDRLFNADILGGLELDCEEPRPEFTEIRFLARFNTLQNKKRERPPKSMPSPSCRNTGNSVS